MTYYTIYKGDDFEFQGSLQECADYLNVKKTSVSFYASNVYKKRTEGSDKALCVIRLEDEENDIN